MFIVETFLFYINIFFFFVRYLCPSKLISGAKFTYSIEKTGEITAIAPTYGSSLGGETVTITGLDSVEPLQALPCHITFADGSVKEISLKCRIDTAIEVEYIEHGGVLHYVLRNLAKAA